MHDRRRAPVERRGGQRAPFVAAVRQKIGADVQLALAQNLGPTGIELKRPPGRAFLPRTPVTLAFELPDGGELVRVQGDVVFERASGGYQTTGIRFLLLTPLDHARILRALRYL
jgi:hypothetical protein